MRHFRHVPNRPGQSPTPEEEQVYQQVAAHLRDVTPLPRVVAVGPGLAAVFVGETWDETRKAACVGLTVELAGGAR